MVSRNVVLEREHAALVQVRSIIERHDPGIAEQLRLLTPNGAIPNSAKTPDQVVLFLAQAVVVLAEQLAELKAANKPRPRGRPPKADKDEAA